jgi:hypothetical protein
MVALAGNLNLFGSRFLTRLTAVFAAGLRQTPARDVCTLVLLIRRHYLFSLRFTFV